MRVQALIERDDEVDGRALGGVLIDDDERVRVLPSDAGEGTRTGLCHGALGYAGDRLRREETADMGVEKRTWRCVRGVGWREEESAGWRDSWWCTDRQDGGE